MNFLSGRARGDAGATRRIRTWVRELAGAGPETTVVVSELRCEDPGCPDVETVIAIGAAGEPLRIKLARPAAAVTRAELEQIFERPEGDTQ